MPRRALVYTRPDRLPYPLTEARLAAAVDAMHRGTPEDGYRLLLRTCDNLGEGSGAVKYLGPSF
ncbi:hypothetical protein [Blastococcus saxobsidens]|uniref:hypothetical protein n=1 Tax=Blastococcus saxobsidens TaxID=138336 RepID=UPI0002DC961C|nr:hypothetical protein [Blastococcus saxobsidens]